MGATDNRKADNSMITQPKMSDRQQELNQMHIDFNWPDEKFFKSVIMLDNGHWEDTAVGWFKNLDQATECIHEYVDVCPDVVAVINIREEEAPDYGVTEEDYE